MEFVVSTQYLENYGAHCEDGKFSSGNAYWKFKNGSDYLVTGLDRPQDAMAFVMSAFSINTIAQKEFPIGVQTLTEWQNQISEYSEDYQQFLCEKLIPVNPNNMNMKEAA